MSAKIDLWVDCNSPYSRFAFLHLRKYAKQLHQHGVEYEVHPVFINGLNAGSGNKPPWMLPAKAAYGKFDAMRAQKYFGTRPMSPPKEFPIKSLLVSKHLRRVPADSINRVAGLAKHVLCQGYFPEGAVRACFSRVLDRSMGRRPGSRRPNAACFSLQEALLKSRSQEHPTSGPRCKVEGAAVRQHREGSVLRRIRSAVVLGSKQQRTRRAVLWI